MKFKELTKGMLIYTVINDPEHAQHKKINTWEIEHIFNRYPGVTEFVCTAPELFDSKVSIHISVIYTHIDNTRVGSGYYNCFTSYEEAENFTKTIL